MARNQKSYSEAFKRELVELYETGERSVRSLEREYDVGKGNLYRWRRQYGRDATHAGDAGETALRRTDSAVGARESDLAPGAGHPKKSYRHLLGTKAVRFQFIEDHRDELSVTRMCKALNVSPSGFYAWRSRPVSAREMENREVAARRSSHGVH